MIYCTWLIADLNQVVDAGGLLVRSGSRKSGASNECGEDSGESLHCVVELVVMSVVLMNVRETKMY